MSDKTQHIVFEIWRVVLEDGEVLCVVVESKAFDFGVRYAVVTEHGPSYRDTARGAVVGHCVEFNLLPAEILAPGWRSRSELEAELASLRNAIAEVNAGLERRARDCRGLNLSYGDTAGGERLQAKASAYAHAAEILREETKTGVGA